MKGIAAPLFGQNGGAVGAISLTCPAERFRKLDMDEAVQNRKEILRIMSE